MNSRRSSHSWQKDSRRLTYSVGHLYGVEGGRKSYSAHSCSSIREAGASSANAQLVCPFAGYDAVSLERAVRSDVAREDLVESIMEAAKTESPRAACKLLLTAKSRTCTDVGSVPEFSKPSQYFQYSAVQEP